MTQTKSSRRGGVASVEPAHVRQAVIDGIRSANQDKGDGYLTFRGILPVELPESTRVAILPDIHVPAHDKLVMWAVKHWLRDFQPHVLVFIGDVADVFALSRWSRPPRTVVNLQGELDETRRLVDELIGYANPYHTFYIMGNHEDRVHRYLTDDASGLGSVLDFRTREPLVSFHGLMGYTAKDPVTFLYDTHGKSGYGGGVLFNDDTLLHHGYIVRPTPGSSPLSDADKEGRTVVHGHTHRVGLRVRQTTRGAIRAIELGHLVNPNHRY
ncbi:MAG: metallophosphoesterase, partial [Cyanobacteria bacterium]|nr:metallophosphoesterase [Cyanobacteriota bacterium]